MKECIYVVEDDENIREIIDLALTSAGYTVKQYYVKLIKNYLF